jgi:hypothetical protein
MVDPVVRLRNVLVLMKPELFEGQDANPTIADAITFEIDSVTLSSPYTMAESNESTGTAVSGAPDMEQQPIKLTIKAKMKGAGAGVVYTPLIKPPVHALLQSCGLRGVFNAGVAPTALVAGSSTTATLGAAFAATAQAYRGMRLLITGGVQAGAHALIADYSAGKVATLVDLFGTPLSVANTAEIKPNWTYAATSPASIAERAADQPSYTIYIYKDGTLRKLLGWRANAKDMGNTAKSTYFEASGQAIWGGQSNAPMPAISGLANHGAPTLNMTTAVSAAFIVNRKPLPISQYSADYAHELEGYQDPNTGYGFGAAQIGGRGGMLECDPLVHADFSVRNHQADIQAAIDGAPNHVGGIRLGQVSGNRLAHTFPSLFPCKADPATRGNVESENIGWRMMNAGRDSSGRDGDKIICFD